MLQMLNLILNMYNDTLQETYIPETLDKLITVVFGLPVVVLHKLLSPLFKLLK